LREIQLLHFAPDQALQLITGEVSIRKEKRRRKRRIASQPQRVTQRFPVFIGRTESWLCGRLEEGSGEPARDARKLIYPVGEGVRIYDENVPPSVGSELMFEFLLASSIPVLWADKYKSRVLSFILPKILLAFLMFSRAFVPGWLPVLISQ